MLSGTNDVLDILDDVILGVYVSLGLVLALDIIVFGFFPALLELETASVYLKTTSAFFFLGVSFLPTGLLHH